MLSGRTIVYCLCLSFVLCGPASSAGYRILLDNHYPIEVSVSFHAALLHWLDSLAGLRGAGLTAGKTRPVHLQEYEHVVGEWTREEVRQLKAFALVRLRFASENAQDDPDALTLAFFDADSLDSALDQAAELLGPADAGELRDAILHFSPLYQKVWRDGYVPNRFVEYVRKDRKRKPMSKFLVRMAEFYEVSPRAEPRPRVVLTPVLDGAGTHAQMLGHYLLLEIRHWERLVDETGPLVHENAHLLFYRMAPEKLARFEKLILASEGSAREAWQVLGEALPTALGQGVAYERFQAERWSLDKPWYHIEAVDRYAKQIFPLVKRTLARKDGVFDEAFLREALALYEE